MLDFEYNLLESQATLRDNKLSLLRFLCLPARSSHRYGGMAFRIADSHVFQVISNLRVASHVCLHGGASTRKYRFNVLPALTQVPNRHISLNFGSADFLIWVYVMLLRRNIHLSVVNYVDYYLLCNSNSHRLEFHLDLYDTRGLINYLQ